MTECDKCGDTDILARTCTYCEGTYCGDDLLPERHNCSALRASDSLGPEFRDIEIEGVTPESDEGAESDEEAESAGEEEEHQTRTTAAEPEYESSPDVAKDGSISDTPSVEFTGSQSSGPGRLKRAVTGARAKAQFHGMCPACDSYIGHTPKRITQCSDCGWRPGLPGLRLLTHWPNYRTLYRQTLSGFWTVLKVVLVVSILSIGVSFVFGTGIPAIDDPVAGVADNVSESSSSALSTSGPNETAIEHAVHQEVNDRRSEAGLDPIAYDTELAAIAESHSQDMAEEGYFSHTEPDGDDFEDRYEEAGYTCRVGSGGGYLTGGENLAQSWWREDISKENGQIVRYDSEEELAEGIVNQWMNSPGHRENILTSDWESEGIGVVITGTDKVYATQNFC